MKRKMLLPVLVLVCALGIGGYAIVSNGHVQKPALAQTEISTPVGEMKKADDKAALEPANTAIQSNNYAGLKKVPMTTKQKNDLDDLFSVLSVAHLQPFHQGQLSDEGMISFSLNALVTKDYPTYAAYHRPFSAADVDRMAVKYFNKHVNGIENKKYCDNVWAFNDGSYKAINEYGIGDNPPFSQINELLDCGNGNYIALVSIYDPTDIWQGDRHANAKDWKPWKPGMSTSLPSLINKARAIIRRINDENGERYIIVEYLKDNPQR